MWDLGIVNMEWKLFLSKIIGFLWIKWLSFDVSIRLSLFLKFWLFVLMLEKFFIKNFLIEGIKSIEYFF